MLAAMESVKNQNDSTDESEVKKDASLESGIDDDESKNDSLLSSLDNSEIEVRVGNESMMFKIDDLKQFPYFEAFLSDRWQKQRHKNKLADNSSSNVIRISDKADLFGINHFKLLIKCIKCNEIPRNKVLTLKDLECLINCADYFCTLKVSKDQNNSDNSSNEHLNPCAVITKTKLTNYFKNRNPLITMNERKRWIIESKNKLISQSMYEYNEFLNKQLSLMRGNSLNLHLLINDQQLTTIQFDSDTAASLFFHKFKFSLNKEKTKLKIKIKGYNKQQWDHLIKLFNFQDYWHYFGKDISYIVEKLLYWSNIASGTHINHHAAPNERSYVIECARDEAESIEVILEDILASMRRSMDGNVTIPHNITRYSLMVSLFSLAYYRNALFPDLFLQFGLYSQWLSNSEIEQFTKLTMRSHSGYLDVGAYNPNYKDYSNNWYKLFMHILPKCSEQFLVDHSNAKLWFTILHEMPSWLNVSKEKMIEFIFDKIIAKFSTQGAFKFGLQLVDYAIYCNKNSNPTKPLAPRYLTFLKDNLGISWDLMAQRTVVDLSRQ